MSTLRDHCGIFGIWGDWDAPVKTYYGIYALQHRGQEAAGIASADDKDIQCHRGVGLVSQVFTPSVLGRLRNPVAIGHVRYSTTGDSSAANAQPLVARWSGGAIALAHNGDLVNKRTLRRAGEKAGSVFHTTTDTETILNLIARSPRRAFEERVRDALLQARGAFSLLILAPGCLVAARDPHGFRPLAMGRLGEAVVFASETCAFDLIGAVYERDVGPGEMVVIDRNGTRSLRWAEPAEVRPAHCIFEHVYFARPDSLVFGDNVHEVRIRLGERLFEEQPAAADVVIPVPDSGNLAALGYSRRSGIPFDYGFVKNHYVGRTFIVPDRGLRALNVSVKLNPNPAVVKGRRLVVVDDSIVRGTTARSRIASLRRAGAREIHLRISCPPTRHPCFYGIDFPSATDLIAAKESTERIAQFIEADSLGYLSEEAMLSAVTGPRDHYCTACFSGRYPVPPEAL